MQLDGEFLKTVAQQVPGMAVLTVVVIVFLKAMKADKESDRLVLEGLRADIRENTKATQDLALAVRLAGQTSCVNFRKAG